MREGEITAQNRGKNTGLLHCHLALQVRFFHSNFEICIRALMQNTQSILNGLISYL